VRAVPAALQAKLDTGVTTLCRCWIVRRRDGVVLGFTDHDRDLVVDGTACRAGTGFAAAEATSRFGLAVDAAEVGGALADDSLNEADLVAGLFDAADIETWLVDWSDPSSRMQLAWARLGEVRREGAAFSVELRGPADRLAQENGRLYTARCAADLGDARCGVDLAAPTLKGEGTVATPASQSSFVASGLDAFADGVFTAGRLHWTSGANLGIAIEIKVHRLEQGATRLWLWQAMPEVVAAGDTFVITAGCDKSFDVCRDRFANHVNFRGFPHIPGNDYIVRYPAAGDSANDGGSLRTA
jgi:uncharacterized phage protein (TIGR02218 family)